MSMPAIVIKRAALVSVLLLIPMVSSAQEAEIIRTITNNFESITNGWHDKLRPAVLYMFWTLAAISWVFTGAQLALKGADLPEIMSELVKIILVIGFWLYVIQNSVEICNAIINSLAKAAGIAGGANAASVAPGDIINHGLELANAVIEQGGFFDALIYGILALFILIAYFFIAGVLFVVMVESYIVAGAGIILLGFGGSPWTSDIARKYLIFALSIGLKLFVTLLVIFFGETLVRGQLNAQSEIKQIFAIAGIIALIAYLTNRLPAMAQSLMSGASSSGPADVRGVAATAGRAAAAGVMAALGSGAALYQAHKAASSAKDGTSTEASATLAAAAAAGSNLTNSPMLIPVTSGSGTAQPYSTASKNTGKNDQLNNNKESLQATSDQQNISPATSSAIADMAENSETETESASSSKATENAASGSGMNQLGAMANKEATTEAATAGASALTSETSPLSNATSSAESSPPSTHTSSSETAESTSSVATAGAASVPIASTVDDANRIAQSERMSKASSYIQRFASAYAQGVAGVAADRLTNTPTGNRSSFDLASKIREQTLSRKIDNLSPTDE